VEIYEYDPWESPYPLPAMYGSWSVNMTVGLDRCARLSEAGAVTLDGNLLHGGRFFFDDGYEIQRFRVELLGRFEWSLDDRSGACELNVQVGRLLATDPEITLSGKVCGRWLGVGP
jgi:hypothetical protein